MIPLFLHFEQNQTSSLSKWKNGKPKKKKKDEKAQVYLLLYYYYFFNIIMLRKNYLLTLVYIYHFTSTSIIDAKMSIFSKRPHYKFLC